MEDRYKPGHNIFNISQHMIESFHGVSRMCSGRWKDGAKNCWDVYTRTCWIYLKLSKWDQSEWELLSKVQNRLSVGREHTPGHWPNGVGAGVVGNATEAEYITGKSRRFVYWAADRELTSPRRGTHQSRLRAFRGQDFNCKERYLNAILITKK